MMNKTRGRVFVYSEGLHLDANSSLNPVKWDYIPQLWAVSDQRFSSSTWELLPLDYTTFQYLPFFLLIVWIPYWPPPTHLSLTLFYVYHSTYYIMNRSRPVNAFWWATAYSDLSVSGNDYNIYIMCTHENKGFFLLYKNGIFYSPFYCATIETYNNI